MALFNAIAKAKRDSQEEEGHDDGGKSEIPTGSKSAADDEVDGEEEDQEEEREEAVQDSRSGVARKSRARAADGANSSVKQHVKAKGKGWAALQDDYLVKPSGGPLSIKVTYAMSKGESEWVIVIIIFFGVCVCVVVKVGRELHLCVVVLFFLLFIDSFAVIISLCITIAFLSPLLYSLVDFPD